MKIGAALHASVTAVTKDWTTVRKKEIKDAARGHRAYYEFMRGRTRGRSIREVAFEVMEDAYLKASGNGALPASARQIMYQARPLILAEIEKSLGKDFDQYFTQQLLPAYLMEHDPGWDVVFDARGHFWEPHTEREIQLGTLNVRRYLADCSAPALEVKLHDQAVEPGVETCGPEGRFSNVLFIEKEGFMPLFREARLAERFDLAIMSTKGVSSTAARTLMEELDGVRFFVLHDFDKYGFAIVGTLQRDTWRYQFSNPPDVIDLGLRLEDVQAEGLRPEPVTYSERNPRANLLDNGATEDEIAYLVTGWKKGQRVELNALPSDRLVAWIERKLEAYDVGKYVPEPEVLEGAYRRAIYVKRINAHIKKGQDAAKQSAGAAKVPARLERRVRSYLRRYPEAAWDDAITAVVEKVDRVWVDKDPGF